jgi:single-strand DNA-binding protein
VTSKAPRDAATVAALCGYRSQTAEIGALSDTAELRMSINRVVLTGNLTQDPELRTLPSGTTVCSLRVASNTRRRTADGSWEDKPNYFDVRVWGAQGEACARFLSRGRAIGVDGRLEWREFETRDGQKRQAVEIVADAVEFLSGDQAPSRGGDPEPPAAAGARRPAPPADDDEVPF